MKIDVLECSQCGSSDFQPEEEFVRCTYCESLFRLQTPQKGRDGAGVVIEKGVEVTFGERSKMIIEGDLILEEGAQAKFLGQLYIVEAATPEKIERAKQLMAVKDEDSSSD